MNEKKLAGSSYIINFYNEIQTLNHNYSQYINVMLEFESKYSDEDLAKVSDQEKQILLQVVQLLRQSLHKVNILYKAICIAVKEKEDEKIIKGYKDIKDQVIINRDNLENYVVLINSFLVKDVVKDLLESASDIIKELYKDDTSTT